MAKTVPWLAAIALAFVVGYGLAGNLASRPMTLYVSEPGEYYVLAPGGNTIYSSAIPPDIDFNIDFNDCEYFESREKYDAAVTLDVLRGEESVAPNCYVAFMPRE